MPEGTITFQPSRYRLQGHRVYLVKALTADSVTNNQARFAQDTQMFGYRRAALPKISCQCTGIRGTCPKAIQDRAPRGVSDSPKCVATGLSAMHATCNLLVTYHET